MGAALLGAVPLAGCADLMQRSTLAPEWFNAKAQEVQGAGYPELSRIPATRNSLETQEQWETAAASLETEAAKIDQRATAFAGIDNDLGDGAAPPTEESIRAMAAQMRAKVEETEAAPRN
jgi:hypothetical protein